MLLHSQAIQIKALTNLALVSHTTLRACGFYVLIYLSLISSSAPGVYWGSSAQETTSLGHHKAIHRRKAALPTRQLHLGRREDVLRLLQPAPFQQPKLSVLCHGRTQGPIPCYCKWEAGITVCNNVFLTTWGTPHVRLYVCRFLSSAFPKISVRVADTQTVILWVLPKLCPNKQQSSISFVCRTSISLNASPVPFSPSHIFPSASQTNQRIESNHRWNL